MFTPPRHLIPPPVYPDVHVSPFISLNCNSYLRFETDHSLVSQIFHYKSMFCIKEPFKARPTTATNKNVDVARL
jgi:hypothetical protein